MLHPIYGTVLGHPELVGDHIANYGALIKEEMAQAGRGLVGRLVAGIVAAVSAMLALGLIGIAVMLGTLLGTFHWVLVLVPGASVVIALAAAYVASRPAEFHAFDELRAQLEADLSVLRLAAERRHDR